MKSLMTLMVLLNTSYSDPREENTAKITQKTGFVKRG